MENTETMICRACKHKKPLSDFARNVAAGPREVWNLRKQCRLCAHVEYLERYQNPKRRKALNQSSANWKVENREHHAKLAREYRKRHPEQIIAQNRLNYAVRKNRIKRQPCEVCGIDKNIQAHHVSYAPEDWYNVRWLCRFCHEIEHG